MVRLCHHTTKPTFRGISPLIPDLSHHRAWANDQFPTSITDLSQQIPLFSEISASGLQLSSAASECLGPGKHERGYRGDGTLSKALSGTGCRCVLGKRPAGRASVLVVNCATNTAGSRMQMIPMFRERVRRITDAVQECRREEKLVSCFQLSRTRDASAARVRRCGWRMLQLQLQWAEAGPSTC